MRRRTTASLIAIGSVAAVVLLAPLAIAGHTNTILTAKLDGRQEVATGATNMRIVGDPNGRGEVYVFGIDASRATLCYVLLVDKIAPANAAHIHRGAKGTNGPVVVTLARPEDGDSADCVNPGEALTQEILANPSEFYVNVHNADYPGGAIRGQLQGR